jgi:hypothetical protein
MTLRRIAASGAACFLIDGDTSNLELWLLSPSFGYISPNLRDLLK